MDDPERVKNFFDINVDDYESKHYGASIRSFMSVRHVRVLEFVDALHLRKGTQVLDAGCGPGYLLEALANRNFAVSGMDAAKSMLLSAKARLTAANPDFPFSLTLGNIEELPYPAESFDLVLSTGVIEYLQHDAGVLSEMWRVLRPGGYLILSVTNLWSPINYFDFFVEFLKRREWFRRPFNQFWQKLGHGPLLPRHFHVRRHRPTAFKRSLAETGFVLNDDAYFYFLPWPRPLDRLFPNATTTLGHGMERFSRSSIGWLAEGYLTVSSKPVS